PRREQSLLTLQNSNRHCLTPKKPAWQLWPSGQFAVVLHGVKPIWPDAVREPRANINKAKAMERRVCISSSQSLRAPRLQTLSRGRPRSRARIEARGRALLQVRIEGQNRQTRILIW